MKRLMNKLNLVLVAGLLFAGCNDMLEDVDPSTSITPEEALGTAEGVDLLRATLYSDMRSSMSFTTQNLIGPSALADETWVRSGASRYQDLNNASGAGTVHLGIYNTAYGVIQVANQLINDLDEGVLDAGTRDQYRGEAYAMRAYAYHNLVKTYGYEPGMYDMGPESNWNLGVPLRTESVFVIEDVDERERASVDDVYSLILSDLDEAEQLLAGSNNPSYANEVFVQGLKARVHLHAGNWEEASQAAQNAIDIGPALVTDSLAINDMFVEGSGDHQEALFKLVINSDTEQIGGSNVNNGPAAYTAQQWWAQLPTQKLLDLFDENDYRYLGWFKSCPAGAGCNNANDLEFASTKYNGDKGNFSDDLPYMRISEMYLIWAEAEAKATGSPADGADPLQELRDARNAGAIPASALTSVEAFEQEILNERMRELHLEGFRFWDLKRLGYHIPNPFGGVKIRNDSHRILSPVGNSALNANSKLVENPVY